jgi:hypothetical protein
MEPAQIAKILETLGCPTDRCSEMATQLNKRAAQLMEERGWSREVAVSHLLKLMAGGWAAQALGVPRPSLP